MDRSTNSVSEFDKYKSKYTAVSSSSSNRWNYRISAFGKKLLVGIECTPFDEETFLFDWEGKTISFRVNEWRELNPGMGDYSASITNHFLEIIPGGACNYVKFNFPKPLTSALRKLKNPNIASINKGSSSKAYQGTKNLLPDHKRLDAERRRLSERRRRKEKERQRQIAEDKSVQRGVVERKKEYQEKRRIAEAQRRQKQSRLAVERKRKKERELSKRLAAERRRLAAEKKIQEEQVRLDAERARSQRELAAQRKKEETIRLAAERKKEQELRSAKVRLREVEDNSRAKRDQVASAQKTLLRELTKLKEEVSRLKKRQIRAAKEDVPGNTWRSSGSGFYLKGSTHVMTNYHVIRKAKVIQVSFPKGMRYRGRVIAIDKSNDLAVVKLSKMRPRQSGFGFRYGARVRVGEEIHALGYPLGASLSRNPSMVSGRISSATGMEDSLSQFRMTAPINAGNSGGPIVNDQGELVGISKGGHVQRGVEGVRFGIKASAAGMILEQIPTSANFDVRVRARKRKRSPSQIFSELSPYVVMIEVK